MSDLNSYEKGLATDLAKAQVRIEELEANLRDMSLDCLAALGQAGEAYQAQLAAESKLAKAVEVLRFYAEGEWPEDYPGGVLYAAGDDADGFKSHLDYGDKARTTLAELEAKP